MSDKQRRELYGLNSPRATSPGQQGLADGDWYRIDIPRKQMKELMKRTDMPAIRDTILWIGLAIGFATAGVLLWGTWWAVPCFAAYGVLYGSASDSRWHESGHGTLFATRGRTSRLPDRVVHADAGPDRLAVEPHPAPHRHPHRGSRS